MRAIWLTVVALLTTIGSVGVAQPPIAAVVRVNADRIKAAQLTSVEFGDAAEQATADFRTERGDVEIPLEHLVRWGRLAPPQAPLLLLADGGQLPVIETLLPLRIEDDKLLADSPTFGELALPLADLQGVVLDLPHDLKARRERIEAVRQAGDQADLIRTDRLLLRNGDLLAGTIVAWDEGQLQMVAAGQTTEVDMAQVASVSFNPALVRKPPPAKARLAVGFADGSVLYADRATTEEEQLQLATAFDSAFTAKVDKVAFLQPLGLSIKYLSDLDATSYKHVPYLNREWKYFRDASVTGGPLRSSEGEHLKGLGMHSPARITYRLDGNYTRFQSSLAIDAAAGDRGSVTCRVYIDDGSGKWKPVYASEVIRGGSAPIEFDVDIAGARQISLLVDYADRGDQLDRINWLDARVAP